MPSRFARPRILRHAREHPATVRTPPLVSAAPSAGVIATQANAGSCDVAVIGGGPAGSTIAALLAGKGWRVELFEKARHPRFHIGESLLPMNLPILERLGVLEEVREIGVLKRGAELESELPTRRNRIFYFSRATRNDQPYAFQVRRSEFDHLLLRRCAASGVSVHEGARVTHVELDASGERRVHAEHESGERSTWCSRFVVDASGRDTLLARHLGTKRRNAHHASAAVFGHFDNAVRRAGDDEGNIGIYWFRHGWFWMIPLKGGVMSVGAVCRPEYLKTRGTDLDGFLWSTIALCPGVSERMRDAVLVGEAQAAGNYSYHSASMHGPGYLLVGDAYTFVDPLFSTGVYLAMTGASLGADAVDAELRGSRGAAARFAAMERELRRAIATLSWFIYRFNESTMRELFFFSQREEPGAAQRQFHRVEAAIISMLAGDLFRGTPIHGPLRFYRMLYLLKRTRSRARDWCRRAARSIGARYPVDESEAREKTQH